MYVGQRRTEVDVPPRRCRRFGPGPAAILGVTFLSYVTWTVLMTQVATDVRKVRACVAWPDGVTRGSAVGFAATQFVDAQCNTSGLAIDSGGLHALRHVKVGCA